MAVAVADPTRETEAAAEADNDDDLAADREARGDTDNVVVGVCDGLIFGVADTDRETSGEAEAETVADTDRETRVEADVEATTDAVGLRLGDGVLLADTLAEGDRVVPGDAEAIGDAEAAPAAVQQKTESVESTKSW